MNAARSLCLSLLLLSLSCQRPRHESEVTLRPKTEAPAPAEVPASYVGSESCRRCHEAAYAAWQRSQHRQAMQTPTSGTVLGNFEQQRVARPGEPTELQRAGDDYTVEATGVRHDQGESRVLRRRFPVKYTFGVAPLQQYLLDAGDGHLQALTLAWDSRPREQGGGRWLDLQPNERTAPGDELHWSSPAYSWNASCADCHSTNLRKGYDPQRAAYDTTFSEISVGCEACHGPGSRHVQQANAGTLDPRGGLLRDFPRPQERAWAFAPGRPIASLLPGSPPSAEVEACAFCHSHRADLGGAALELHDRYRVDLLERELFEPDGQQKQETFEVGSFLQSKMHAAGVVCSDCHEPHAGSLRRPGNALCTGCHEAQTYDSARHHLHEAPGAARECVQCHMPTRTFMQIDARREHRFAVPRPDLTLEGVPNPCTEACHAERRKKSAVEAARWAAHVVVGHFGERREPSFAAALAEGRALGAKGRERLSELLVHSQAPAIVRATALAELRAYPEAPLTALLGSLRDASPLVRRALAESFGARPESERHVLVPLLGDAARSVRLEAARALLDAPGALHGEVERRSFRAALAELRASLEHNADRAGALLELARIELASSEPGRAERAEALFQRALGLEPGFAAAYLNYADFLRAQQREGDALQTLHSGLEKCRERAPLEHALGLLWVRRGDKARGLEHLERAYRLAPDAGQLGYVYAVALFDAGRRARAVELLQAINRRAPGDVATAELLARYTRSQGRP